MKPLTTFIFSLLFSLLSFSQEKETKMSVQLSNGTFFRILDDYRDLYNLTKLDVGLNFRRAKGDFYLYVTYGYNTDFLSPIEEGKNNPNFPNFKSHTLGGSFKYHLLNNQKNVRPYLGLSILSEIATNYRDGMMTRNSFFIIDSPINSMTNSYKSNISNFYHSTPFLGTLSLGCDFRLSNDLRLNLSAGYDLKKMKYKYLEWYDGDDYREMLKNTPVESRIFAYVNAQLGLSYAFSFKKSKEMK